MDTMQLRYFITAAERRSFTAAAARFGITQPTICRQISALEDELGVKLLIRTSRGVSLTTAGIECMEYAQQLLDVEDQALSRVVSISEGRLGIVRIAISPSCAGVLNGCLSRFAEVYPDIQVNVDMLSNFYSIEQTDGRSYDFYFLLDNCSGVRERKNCLCIKKDRYHFLVHKNDVEMPCEPDFFALSQRPFLSISRSSEPIIFEHVLALCRTRGFAQRHVSYHSHYYTALIAVNAGMGITVLPSVVLDDVKLDNVYALPIQGDDAVCDLLMVWPEDSDNFAARRFLQTVRTMISTDFT